MVDLAALLPLILGCAAAFAVGGFVKGVTSIGLPLVALPILTLMVAIVVSDEFQETLVVMSRVEPPAKVPMAVNWRVVPACIVAEDGVTEIEQETIHSVLHQFDIAADSRCNHRNTAR